MFYALQVTDMHSTLFWFSDDLVEKNQKEITIHDLDALALTLLVDFAYTGEIVISEDNVQVRNNIKHIDKWSNIKIALLSSK